MCLDVDGKISPLFLHLTEPSGLFFLFPFNWMTRLGLTGEIDRSDLVNNHDVSFPLVELCLLQPTLTLTPQFRHQQIRLVEERSLKCERIGPMIDKGFQEQ